MDETREWRRVGYLWDEGRNDDPDYWLCLPAPLCDWDVYEKWERVRTRHMAANLERGNKLYDVGAEKGWQSCVYAQIVGGDNMVLVEPSQVLWPNIQQTWAVNVGPEPAGCYDGLLSTRTSDPRTTFGRWPAAVNAPLCDATKYGYLGDDLAEMRLDDLVDRTGVVPDAITIDVEGAELAVLQGAEHTLRHHHPKVWVSVHPDLMAKYGGSPKRLQQFMSGCEYGLGTLLDTDHEEHWFYG